MVVRQVLNFPRRKYAACDESDESLNQKRITKIHLSNQNENIKKQSLERGIMQQQRHEFTLSSPIFFIFF